MHAVAGGPVYWAISSQARSTRLADRHFPEHYNLVRHKSRRLVVYTCVSEVTVDAVEGMPAQADDAIFRDLYSGLRRFAAVVGSLDQDPDDLVQEAVARALRRAPLHTLGAPGAYLRRSITNLATDARRSERRRARALALLRRDVETSVAGSSDLSGLDRLQPIDRALLYLVDAEGHDFRYAASLLGLSDSAARSRASRARQRLRNYGINEE